MIRAGVVAVVIGTLLLGCAPRRPVAPAVQTGTLAVATHNQRVAQVQSLWARAVVQVWYPDDEGNERREQLEGHLNYRSPRGLVMTFMKVGEIGAVLGSNDERYWWAEVRDPKLARVGRHERATAARLDEFGLPVAPLDLIDLLGLSPLPDGVRAEGDRALVAATATGSRVVRFNVEGEPDRVELRDQAGRVRLAADLSSYEPLAWRGGPRGGATPRVPTLLQLSMDAGRVRARIQLYDPEAGGPRPRPEVFAFETWTQRYRVTDIRDLDAPPQ